MQIGRTCSGDDSRLPRNDKWNLFATHATPSEMLLSFSIHPNGFDLKTEKLLRQIENDCAVDDLLRRASSARSISSKKFLKIRFSSDGDDRSDNFNTLYGCEGTGKFIALFFVPHLTTEI